MAEMRRNLEQRELELQAKTESEDAPDPATEESAPEPESENLDDPYASEPEE